MQKFGTCSLSAFRKFCVPALPRVISEQTKKHQLADQSLVGTVLSSRGPCQVTVLQPWPFWGYCSPDRSQCEINLVQYIGLSVSVCVGTMSLSNWGLISVESMKCLSCQNWLHSCQQSWESLNKNIFDMSCPLDCKTHSCSIQTSCSIYVSSACDRDKSSIFQDKQNKLMLKSWNRFPKIPRELPNWFHCFSFPVFY